MPERITRDTLTELLNQEEQICLSLYMPLHRKFPQSNQDLIRYKNLIRELRHQLEEQHPEAEHDALMKPFEDLMDDHDAWIHQGEGLAVLGGERFFKVYPVQRSVPERISVNRHPYVSPLIRIAQSADCYQALLLTRNEVRLFEGNRDSLVEVELDPHVPRTMTQALGNDLTQATQSGHPDGFSAASRRGDPYMHESGGSDKQEEIDLDRDRFFREVDRAIVEHHSHPSNLPLILVALPENQAFFRAGTHNEHLVQKGVEIDPAALDNETLRQRCWEIMSKQYDQRLDGILDRYGVSRGQGLASDQLEEIGPATVSGRVATLLVEAERTVHGKINHNSGEVQVETTAENPDLLDELALHGIQTGGDVVIVPGERMPTKSGAAAVFRF